MQEYAMAGHSQRSIAVFALLSVFAMLAAGCGTSMQTSSEDLNRLTATEGIVVGSVHIKGGKDILGRTGWTLIAQRITGPLSALAPDGFGYRLNASRGGEEEVFVTKMEGAARGPNHATVGEPLLGAGDEIGTPETGESRAVDMSQPASVCDAAAARGRARRGEASGSPRH